MKITKEMDLIYKRYYRDVYGFCVRLCEGHPEMAEDICQETFFKALKNADSFRGDSKILSWLCQIAKNTYISHLRKEKHLLKTKDMEVLLENVANIEENTQEKLEDQDSVKEIKRIMSDLEPPYDEVFRMKVVQEKSYSEIAAIYHKSENWARVTYFRAKQRIVEQMRQEGHYE